MARFTVDDARLTLMPVMLTFMLMMFNRREDSHTLHSTVKYAHLLFDQTLKCMPVHCNSVRMYVILIQHL